MSCSIRWRPVSDKANSLEGTSETLKAIGMLAGYDGAEPPYRLTQAHLPALKALASVHGLSTWCELWRALEDFETIDVWGEW